VRFCRGVRAAPPVRHPAAALNELRTIALMAILGERAGSGVEILGYFGRRRQRREFVRHDGLA
jgi:hypothetical protein